MQQPVHANFPDCCFNHKKSYRAGECQLFNWSKKAFCTNKIMVRVTWNNPKDVLDVCNCHMMNLAKYDQLKGATWQKIHTVDVDLSKYIPAV
jgi:hypothetical protein